MLSVKSECLSGLVFFGEMSLWKALNEYMNHYHQKRNHQGKENQLLFSSQDYQPQNRNRKIKCRSRLGGKLMYYFNKAA